MPSVQNKTAGVVDRRQCSAEKRASHHVLMLSLVMEADRWSMVFLRPDSDEHEEQKRRVSKC